MPSVTFTYPDELQELVHNAACSQYGYLEEIDNPEFERKLLRKIEDSPLLKNTFIED